MLDKGYKILGIDPGSYISGFAIIEAKKKHPIQPSDFMVVNAGVLKVSSKLPHAKRIWHMHRSLKEVLDSCTPNICVIEKAFVGVNMNSALRLGEARGALITSVQRLGIDITEATPTKVKKAIAGHGRASKEEISTALKILMKFDKGKLPFDVTDALALALFYGLTHPFINLTTKPGRQYDHLR